MLRTATQLTLVLSLVVWPAAVMGRAPRQAPADPVAAAQAQAASSQTAYTQANAQVTAAQAAYTQANAQVTAAQAAYRAALQNAAKALAGPAQTAAQAAVQQAAKNMAAAQGTARQALVAATQAQQAAAQANARAVAAQNMLARQIAMQQAAQKAAAQAAAQQATVTPQTAAQPTAASKTGTPAAGAKSTTGTANSGTNEFNTILGDLTASGGTGSKSGAGGAATSATTTAGANGAATGAAPGNALVSSGTSAKSGRGAQPGNTNGAPAAAPEAATVPARKGGTGFANGALGVGQSTDTLLTVYGCSRMGTQVSCDADLSNQNQSVTQMNSADQWKDVYLQDDVGDNHLRSMGLFENDNGDQRMQIVLPYGEKSRYILVFNGVPANVKTVTLKSSASMLDVESIPVTTPQAPAADGQTAGAASGQAAAAPGVVPATAAPSQTKGGKGHS